MRKILLTFGMAFIALFLLTGCDEEGSVIDDNTGTNGGSVIDQGSEDSGKGDKGNVVVVLKKGETKTVDSTYSNEAVSVELTLNGVTFESLVEPPTPQQYYYSYYEAAEGKTLVKIDLTVKNVGGTTFDSDRTFENFLGDNCSPEMVFDGKYTYNGLTVVGVDKDSDGEYDLDTYYYVDPLDTANFYLLNEVPSDVKSMPAEINVCLGETTLKLEF